MVLVLGSSRDEPAKGHGTAVAFSGGESGLLAAAARCAGWHRSTLAVGIAPSVELPGESVSLGLGSFPNRRRDWRRFLARFVGSRFSPSGTLVSRGGVESLEPLLPETARIPPRRVSQDATGTAPDPAVYFATSPHRPTEAETTVQAGCRQRTSKQRVGRCVDGYRRTVNQGKSQRGVMENLI